MKLDRITIVNFRSIKEQTIKFDRNFQTLVGINESGKSNILKAISMLNENIKFDKNDIRDPSHDEDTISDSYIRYIFKYTNSELKTIYEEIKKHILSKKQNTFIVTIGDKQQVVFQFLQYKSEVIYTVNLIKQSRKYTHWRIDGPTYTINNVWKKPKENINATVEIDGQNIDISNYSLINTEDYPSIAEEHLEDVNIDDLNSIAGKFFINYSENETPECIVWNYKESNLLPGKINLSQFSTDPNVCVPLKNMFILAGHVEISIDLKNAETKVNGIRNILRKVSENTTSHMKKVWPEWKNLNVSITQNGEFLEAGIEDEYNFYSLERRSDGFKRFFTFLLMISVQNKTEDIFNNIIIIDEPDIGLHPSGIQYLNEELKKIGENNIVIISTHSIFMIDKEIVDRHIIVEKKNEITEIKRVEPSNINDEEVIYKALGYSVFELLKPSNIIFEGWRDKKIFNTFTKSSSKRINNYKYLDSVGFLHAMGVKDINRIANMCENFNRKYVIITDSDKPAKEKKKLFDGTGEWLCYDDIDTISSVTTEDFISKKLIEKSTNECLKSNNISIKIDFNEFKDTNIIEQIKNELNKIIEKPEDIKSIINEIKEYICLNTKYSDLNENYLLVCQTLIDRLMK